MLRPQAKCLPQGLAGPRAGAVVAGNGVFPDRGGAAERQPGLAGPRLILDLGEGLQNPVGVVGRVFELVMEAGDIAARHVNDLKGADFWFNELINDPLVGFLGARRWNRKRLRGGAF